MNQEQEKTFVAKTPEKLKNPGQYVFSEMQDDISAFPEAVRPAVEKYCGGKPLDPKEHSAFTRAQNIWWQEKYGFPYDNKIAREELLRRKYDFQKELTEQQKFQAELFGAFRDNNAGEIARLQKIYEEKYPDQLEGIAALFGLVPFLRTQRSLKEGKKERGWDEESLQHVRHLTEYQFLLSDFIRHNGRDKNFLSIFWEALEGLAEKSDFLKDMHSLRRSTLSTVALMKVFEALGKNPTLSHPAEDAFRAIDLWLDSESVVQVKGGHLRDTPPVIVETDSVSFPAVAVHEGGEDHLFDSYLSSQAQKFSVKIKKYEAVVGKKLKGYFAVIPYEKFDFVTGEPDNEIVEKIRDGMIVK